MKSWKRLENFCADFLNWKRLTKQHYGQSQHDIEGNGFKGDCKHYAKHRIHSIKQKADMLYRDDILIFTKVKGTHYEPHNVIVSLSLGVFDALLKCKRIAEKLPNKVDKIDNCLVTNLKTLMYKLEQVKLLTNDMKKLLKEIEEVK